MLRIRTSDPIGTGVSLSMLRLSTVGTDPNGFMVAKIPLQPVQPVGGQAGAADQHPDTHPVDPDDEDVGFKMRGIEQQVTDPNGGLPGREAEKKFAIRQARPRGAGMFAVQ